MLSPVSFSTIDHVVRRRPGARLMRAVLVFTTLGAGVLRGAPVTKPVKALIDGNCADCHDADTRKAGLDLTAFTFEPGDPKNFAMWVKVHDRVAAGEMPPKKHEQPEVKAVQKFVTPGFLPAGRGT
jgi:hypothetical protein